MKRKDINFETARAAAKLTDTIAGMRNPKFYAQVDYNFITGEVFACGIKDETRKTLNKMSNSPYTIHIALYDAAQTTQDIMRDIRLKLLSIAEILDFKYEETPIQDSNTTN